MSLFNGIKEEMRQQYNQSFRPKLGSQDYRPDHGSMIETIEICRSFELAHDIDGRLGAVYVDDPAFPDHFNHGSWSYYQSRSNDRFHIDRAMRKMKQVGII